MRAIAGMARSYRGKPLPPAGPKTCSRASSLLQVCSGALFVGASLLANRTAWIPRHMQAAWRVSGQAWLGNAGWHSSQSCSSVCSSSNFTGLAM